VYDRLASEYGWPSDPHAGSQTQKAPCTKAKCTHLQGLIQHANFVCGQHRPSSSFDDDDDEGGPPKVLVHKALEEVLREETHAPQPGAGIKAAEQKTERMPWPPMLFIKAQPCELEDSKDKLKTRFSKWGPDRLTPIYRGSPPQFTGAVVLTFGSATHEQLMKQSPGSDDVCAEQATAFDKARELHLLLLSKKCQEAARGISEVRYVTEPEWEQWKSVCARSVGKSTFWGRDLVGSGKWGEKMRVRWVDSREQHAKVEEARQTEREEQQRATAAAAAQAQAAQAAQAAAQQRASEEEEKRRELEEAQRARDESIQEQRQRIDKLAQQLGAQEQKTVLAQERQRTAEDKWRAVQQERDLLERNASELTDSMSRELARQERELREKQREVEQLSAGTAAAAAASGEVARKEAELQRLREDKAQSDREHKQKLQALDAELKEKEEAAEGSEFKFFRNDHLEMKNLRAEMYEQVKAVKKNECTNGLPPFKIFGELDQGEVTRLLFPKGVQPAQAEEMIYQNSALQNSFWSKDPGSTSSWPPFDPTKVFKLVRKVVDDKDVTEYLIAEEDEKIRKQTPQRGPDGRLTGAWVLEESEELKQDTTFTKYVRRRFGKKQGDAFLGYVLDKYREYVEYAGSLGHKADAVHRILWNYEQEREMTAMEMFRVLVPIKADR